MSRIQIANNHVTFNGVRFFTRDADAIRLGTSGEKVTPVFGINGINPKDQISVPRLQKVKAATATIGEEGATKNSFDGSVMALVDGVPTSVNGSVAYEMAKKDELKLMHVYVSTRDLIDDLNASPDILDELRRYGHDARVVSDCLFLIKGTETSSFKSDVDVKVEAGKGPLDLTLHNDHGASGTTTIHWDHRVNYAYLLQKIDWNDAKTRVVDLNPDTQGL